jgi:co-chaperonin GroES (HSP10)
MQPLREWLAIERENIAPRSAVWTPAADQGDCLVGTVQAIGSGTQRKFARIPIEAKAGERVVYSNRVDAYEPKGKKIDLIQEQSIMGWAQTEPPAMAVGADKPMPFLALLQDRVCCKEIKTNETLSGIILPTPPPEQIECEVIQVGPGKFDNYGKRVAMSVKPGDRVLVNNHQKQAIRVAEEDYIILKDEHIRAIL